MSFSIITNKLYDSESKQWMTETVEWCDKWLFTAGQHQFIHQYDIFDKKKSITVTGGFTWCLAVSPDKTLLAVCCHKIYLNVFLILYDYSFRLELNKVSFVYSI